jgi:hypothetical protein
MSNSTIAADTPMTAAEVIQQIIRHGQENANDTAARPTLITNDRFSAQGDINIWKVESLEDLGTVTETAPVYQLAPGNTRGSRHCLDEASVANAKFYVRSNANALQGPIWVNEEQTLVTHPEHGDQLLDPGIYFVTYQRQYADDLKRMAD